MRTSNTQPPPTATNIQFMLDENCQLIQSIIDHHSSGMCVKSLFIILVSKIFFEIKLPYLILAWVTNNCHAWKPMIAYISKKRFWSSCLLNIPLFSFGNFMRVSILLTTSTQRRTKIRCRVFGSVRQKYRILIKTDVWSSTVRKISATRFA